MTATAHALIGGAIAAAIPEPAIGLPLAFISHPIADMIPHWDLGWGWRKKLKSTLFLESAFDLTLGIVLAFLIFGSGVNSYYLLGAIFAAELLDILQAPYWLLNWRFPPFSWVYKIQHSMQGKAKLPWGILTQAATVITLVIVLRAFH